MDSQALETITLPSTGCKLEFHSFAVQVVAITSKLATVKINRAQVSMWACLTVSKNVILSIAGLPSPGFRVY
jgi:allophanate hydrolase subunit 2